MWLLHPSFQDLVANCWRNTTPAGCPMYVTLQKLKALKLCLKHWNYSVFGNVHRFLEEARAKLADIQQTISSNGFSEHLFAAEVEAKTAVLDATRRQEAFWRDRAKVQWLTDGDKCTSFFHAYARNKTARARINCLHDGHSLLTDLEDISNHVVTFYQSLYGPGTPPRGIDEICNIIPNLITGEENAMLTAMPSPEEIKRTVFSMNPSSSPGPDGFPGAFYHNCWDIVGADVVAFVQYFFQHNWWYPNANSNFIVLLPKVEGANLISQFRPIALANFLFKIIQKILADRLGPIASRIISANQSAFLPGRRISDCIGLVSEGFNLLDRKTRGGNVGIKVDIAKAFDTLNWQFLFQVLHHFGFSPDFVNYVNTILNSARLSVMINGSPKGYFPCARGVRQGDPLSPLLFCIAEEALSRGLSSLFASRRVKPISLPRGCSLTHVLYADDLFIFCRGDISSLTCLQSFLESYGQASGQLVNTEKSTFHLGDSYAHRRRPIHRILGFKCGSAPFTYLGVPIFKGKPCRLHLQPLADKAKARLVGWTGKLLSMAGRVQLVHDVFQSMLLHSFSTYLWPSSLIKYLSTCARNFIWSGNIAIKKLVTVSWNQICAPKKEAGVGLRHLKTLNSTALLTMGWRVLTVNSAWSIFARRRFSIFHHMKIRYFGSSIWHGLKVSLSLLFQNSKWLIGDGQLVQFWTEKWLDIPIVDKLHATTYSAHLTSTIASFISNQSWALLARFCQAFPDLAKEIMLVPLPLEPISDSLVWEHSGNGTLSFSFAYEQLRPKFLSPTWVSSVWRNYIPPHYSLLAWRLFHHKLPTDDQLQKRGIPMVSVCQLCNFGFIEDQTHLFFNCSFAQHVWQWLTCCFGCSLPSSGSLLDLWNAFTHKAFSTQLKNLWLAGGLYVIMAIWKSRNKLRFENKKPSLMRVFRSIKAWLQFVAPHTPGDTNGVLDAQLLLALGVTPTAKTRKENRLVLWHPPISPWIKLNTDGLAKGNPGPAACGGVFRDCQGRFIGGFSTTLGHHNAFFSELMAVIIGVELAFQLGWHCVWLECDSTSVVECFSKPSFVPPWQLRIPWLNCVARTRVMSFFSSHVLREGNTVADRLANLGLSSPSLVWHTSPPVEIIPVTYGLSGFSLLSSCLAAICYRRDAPTCSSWF
ncbi:uncharacterized protein LOC133744853 [Rosa rugosa]|uniref:uncharacterized protein LOC133744853 n=1 Tax=Rosa rugosa TaxID=74645 RepID=UPI002B40C83B|nr:uncharacterized protein LOC133744853 [Rosa rugosa]